MESSSTSQPLRSKGAWLHIFLGGIFGLWILGLVILIVRPSSAVDPASPAHQLADRIADRVVQVKTVSASSGTPDTYGSGVVVEFDGDPYILTNFHTIAGHKKIRIVYTDGTSRTVDEFARDEERDLALLTFVQKTSDPIPTFSLGDTQTLRVGDPVLSAGFPFQFDLSLTSGIISGKQRDIQIKDRIHPLLWQTDAAINRGFSGGPVFNQQGEVIGINVGNVPEGENIGFFIPIEAAQELYRSISVH